MTTKDEPVKLLPEIGAGAKIEDEVLIVPEKCCDDPHADAHGFHQKVHLEKHSRHKEVNSLMSQFNDQIVDTLGIEKRNTRIASECINNSIR